MTDARAEAIRRVADLLEDRTAIQPSLGIVHSAALVAAAILAASSQVEWFDEIHRDEPARRGIHTLPPLDCVTENLPDARSRSLNVRFEISFA